MEAGDVGDDVAAELVGAAVAGASVAGASVAGAAVAVVAEGVGVGVQPGMLPSEALPT